MNRTRVSRVSGIKFLSMSATVYCKCGELLHVRGIDVRPAIQVWRANHTGDGHGPCKRTECIKARRIHRHVPAGQLGLNIDTT